MYGKKFYRRKTIERIGQELEFFINKYNPEFIYFVGDSFLSMPEQEWRDFCEMYSHYKLPFWMNTRAEPVTCKKIQDLEDLGCIRCNIGIDHGNEEYRKEFIGRHVRDDQIIRACEFFKNSKIKLIVNSIIGFPDETKDLIQDTINLSRKVAPYISSASAFVFTPYHGTALRDVAVEKGLIDKDVICCSSIWIKHC